MSSGSVPRAALAWIASGDTGVSSEAIFAVMTGVSADRTAFGNYPHDPSDFGRCYRLLRRVPEWRDRIGEMAREGAEWAALAAVWGELTALYEEEIGTDLRAHYRPGATAPRLYARMQAIINPIEDARGNVVRLDKTTAANARRALRSRSKGDA